MELINQYFNYKQKLLIYLEDNAMTKSNITWNAKQIAKMVQNGSLKFDNAVQRGFVWDKKRQTLLIDSMLREYPIPPMYTIKSDPIVNEKGKEISSYDCLDGKQRCTTIAQFINDGFALGDMDFVVNENGDEEDISGFLFSELPEEYQDKILSCSLTVYFFTDINEDEITEMMARLNNGKSLTSYELSRVKAKDLAGIQQVTQHQIFDEISNKGYACEDIVVKSYAMLTEAEPCLDTKVIRPMIEQMELDDEDMEHLNNCFNLIDGARDIILEDANDPALNRKIAKKIITKTHLVSLVPIAYDAYYNKVDEEMFAEFLQYFFSGTPSIDDEYNAACQNGVGHTQNVKARNDALNRAYENFKREIGVA